ncbi:hypothetical protein [Kitasatospora sp. McL0602]|uniref:hypothetical protein n=1 Tax=Kitasatospora sp. McL0602 TaxID=3439530 RepID=UPI003F8B25E8
MSEGPQGGHGWGSAAGGGSEPDWAALADRNEQDSRRRKQRRVVGAVVGATLVIGGITATAVNFAGKGADRKGGTAATGTATLAAPGPASTAGDNSSRGFTATDSASPSASTSNAASESPSASATASATASGSAGVPKPGASNSASRPASAPATPAPGPVAPSSSAPPDPLTVISSAATDTASLDPAVLFADHTLTVGGRTWTRITTVTTTPCYKATTGGLGDTLAAQSCQSMLRATYASGSSAVTVAVGVFDHRSQADAAQAVYKGQAQGLVTPGSTSFCTSPSCANTHGAIGRYTYYTVSGTLKPGGTTADPVATAAGPTFSSYAHDRLLARGR